MLVVARKVRDLARPTHDTPGTSGEHPFYLHQYRRRQPTPADGDRTTILGGVHGAGAVKRQHVRRMQNRHPTVRLGVYALSC